MKAAILEVAMFGPPNSVSLQDLLSRDLEFIKEWLGFAPSGQGSAPGDFNWLGLAKALASNVRRATAGAGEALAWAEAALSAYARLAGMDTPTARSSAESGMMLRAYMIRKYGVAEGHAVLDPRVVLDWFRDGAMSFDSAAALVEQRRSLGLDELRALRRIKNRLRVIGVLAQADGFQLSGDVKRWLDLLPRLP